MRAHRVIPDGKSGLPSRPRRFRITLRAFFVLFTVVCLSFGWLTRTVRNQQVAIDVITQLGGRFGYDYKPDGDEELRRQLERRAARRAGRKPPLYVDGPWAPQWLRNLVGDDYFSSVAVVNLSRTFVTDEDLRCLRGLPRLRHLYLASVPRVTDDGLAVLASLHRLEHLDLGYNNLDSGGLSDTCLVHLSGLRHLTNLSIANNRFTDAGFRHLEPLTDLEFLSVVGTNITRDAIEQFKQSTPKCSVY